MMRACPHLEHDLPLTAAEEDRARRKKAYEEQAKSAPSTKSWSLKGAATL